MDLSELRSHIDALDETLIGLLAKRMKISTEMAEFKRKNSMEIIQPTREREVLENRRKTARQFGLSEKFTTELFQLILNASRDVQMGKDGGK